LRECGIDENNEARGGVEGVHAEVPPPPREIYMLQRKNSKIGAGLGKTTGWIHRISLRNKQVKLINGVAYDRISDKGLHITRNDKSEFLEVDTIVICAGQLSENKLYQPLKELGVSVHMIGGADRAGELDAKRAIDQGCRLAAKL